MKTISPRRILAAILLLALLLTALPIGVLAAELSFTDVPKSEWYYEDVRLAVEGGLVNGKSPTIYAPNDNVTYAETVKLAACIHKLTDTGSTEFAAGTVWYQPYVDYARSKQIISKDYDWNTAATRAHFMDIFSRAISSNPTLKGTKPLDAINTVEDGAIPDVPMTHPQAGSIYKLYRAGVVQGSDKQYSCKPNTNIRRSEVAAILTRMVYADKRLSFTVGDANALRITKQPQNVSGKATNTLKLSVEAAGGKTPYTYDYADLKPFSTAYLPGFLADKYDVSVEDSRERADKRCAGSLVSALERTVSGYATCNETGRDIHLKRGKVHYALLPVWILNTRWEGKDFLFAMNGQTGKLVGNLPVSTKRVVGLFAAIAALLIAISVTALLLLVR